MKTHGVVLTSLALLLAAVAPCQADTLRSTLGQPMREVAHAVGVSVQDGVAQLVVRRSFAHTGKKHDEAVLELALPYGHAATGLRIRSATRWYRGELMEAEKARKLYNKLTGVGPHAPRDPALLRWVWENRLELFVFPVIPKLANTVEITFTAPTRYAKGRYTLSYPRPKEQGGKFAPVILHVEGNNARVDEQPLPAGQPVVLRSVAEEKQRVDARSQLVVDEQLKLTRFQVGVDIRHTYRGDLRVVLVAPTGKQWVLHDREGGAKDDVRLKKTLTLEKPLSIKGRWTLLVNDNAALDVGVLRAFSLSFERPEGKQRRRIAAKDLPQTIPEHAGGDRMTLAKVSLPAPKIDTVAARLGRVAAGKGVSFSRFELDVAYPLRPLPEKLKVIFVVDASHSIAHEGIGAQLDLARAFLSHVPDARCDIVLFRRFARRLVGRLVSGKELFAQLEKAEKKGELATANGSALGAGMKIAAQALAKERGPTMVLSLSDALLRPSWRNRDARRFLRQSPRATSHVVVASMGGRLEERRDDKHALADLAAKQGGVLLRISGLRHRAGSKASREATRQIALGLVRPIRIDHAKVVGVPASFEIPETLKEGVGLREMAKVKNAPRSVLIEGKIWAKTFRRRVLVNSRFSRQTAAFVFSHSKHTGLDRQQMLRVAFFGKVVSPVTSYLAIEPGVRPSTAGLDRIGMGRGSGGFGRGAGVGRSRYHRPPPPSIRPELRALIKRCVAQHGAPKKAGELVVHTTLDEIVDVETPRLSGPLSRCVAEGAWAIRLPKGYRNVDRKRIAETVP